MILSMYAIQDLKSGFLTPTIETNDAVAKRNFEHAIQNTNTIMFSHQEDFRLMRLATYDTETGRIIPLDLIELVCDGKDVLL